MTTSFVRFMVIDCYDLLCTHLHAKRNFKIKINSVEIKIFIVMFIYICNLQIRQKKHSESMIRYWIEDNLGGYQMESRDYFIRNTDIIRSILRPTLRKVGRTCCTYIFLDFK